MTDIKETKWLRWTPEPGQRVHLRTGGSDDEREAIALDELELQLSDEPGIEPVIVLRFSTRLADYVRMQQRRWFDIPLGFIDNANIAFTPDHPIAMEVATRPLERTGYPLSVLLMTAEPGKELETVVEPFLDPELERPINNPLFYEVVRISQPGPGGEGPGFDRHAIQAWEQR